MFYIHDIEKQAAIIEQMDLVLISAGLNDIRFKHASAQNLVEHLRYISHRFPRTQFLFDSITPLLLKADRFNVINDIIDSTNLGLLYLSLNTPNFKLFDNMNFGPAHLSHDGIHMNDMGKRCMSVCWVNSILIQLGLKPGPLTLRRGYARRAGIPSPADTRGRRFSGSGAPRDTW